MLLNASYAARKDLAIGEKVTLDGKRFEVIGFASAPLGGQASDIYLKLSQLQAMSDRKGRVNTLYVRADSADAVSGVAARIRDGFPGAETTTSQDLAERVTGSLSDAKDLAGKLGGALTIVGLLAAFLIAGLLTLSSVTKRTRELGTLKAIGWPQRLVVRQVTGEALAQGALGGVLGAPDRRGWRCPGERHRSRARGHGRPGGVGRPEARGAGRRRRARAASARAP